MTQKERIQELLAVKPGLRAQQIAGELGLERPLVVGLLHELLNGQVVQDSSYRWWLKTPKVPPDAAAEHNGAPPESFLGRVCRYYLECLSRESGTAISIAADDSAGYVILTELPFAHQGIEPWDSGRAIRKLVQKTRRERTQLTLYVGYPLRRRTVMARDGEEQRLDPVFLYPLEETPDEPGSPLRPASSIPQFNLEVLKTLPAVGSGNLTDEALHLSEELSLANPDDELPPWDEIVLRLPRSRPEWGWREKLNPYSLSPPAPLEDWSDPGIYNRAILFAGTRSPFTYGLEVELRKLMKLDELALRGTALGAWLSGEQGEGIQAPEVEDRPILEVVPLNTEQRQAVVQGLSAPLTVVTGPPGTGKSQVVTSLLANVAWQESSALFSSKNNHAVDVVEARINGLGAYPLLLRLGKEEHQARIAQQLSSWLAETSSTDATARYQGLLEAHQQDRARYTAVQREIASVVSLRNTVDNLERAAEPARALFGAARFSQLRAVSVPSMRGRYEALAAALDAAERPGPGAMARLLGDAGGSRRLERVSEAAAATLSDAQQLGLDLPIAPSLEQWREFRSQLAQRLDWAQRVSEYGQALEQLRRARPLERLASDLTQLAEESAQNALELWQAWLRLWPSRWDPERRKLLSEYVSLLQMIASGDRYEEGVGRRVFRRYYSLFAKVTQALPCWAVTSLSARGRLPFEAAICDLVVIDEASQCDIASALPLLYRARRAVIIGDPLQLKHVSTVAPQEDRMLLSAHGLAEGHAAWAYSVNSLFDLARSLCRYQDLVNLRDHHRSHRDIISFSNRYFYRGGLRIATDHGRLKRTGRAGPAVQWVNVTGKVVRPHGGGALNPIEAAAVVEAVRTLVLEQDYRGAIGVVTPFRAHANRIRTLVQQDADLAQRLASLPFVVDTVHGFQGDERDVIFFSPVVSAGTGESTLHFLKSHGNLFNVAITRARSELVVVGDRQAALDSGVPYLAGFAEYTGELASDEAEVPPAPEAGAEYPRVPHPEHVSEWERIFYRAMYGAGIRPVPQYVEAPYTLDFALFQGRRKLDIEVDGENYHRNWDGELCRRDQLRSRRLSDSGWEIMRFWVYEIRDDPAESVQRVKAWMEGTGYLP